MYRICLHHVKISYIYIISLVVHGSRQSEAGSTVFTERRTGFGRLDFSSAYRLTAAGVHHCAESKVIASLLFKLQEPSWLI